MIHICWSDIVSINGIRIKDEKLLGNSHILPHIIIELIERSRREGREMKQGLYFHGEEGGMSIL